MRDTRIGPDSVVLFALALYVGLTAGERIARSRLLDLLWPDVAEGSRRHALRQLLYRLRSAGLEVALDGEELFVDPVLVEADIRALLAEDWADNAEIGEVLGAAPVVPSYAPALAEPFREWLDALRARVARQQRRALLRHIAEARRAGRWSDVGEWSRRCLELDPLNEEATLARAEGLAMEGAKASALQLLDDYLWELGDRSKQIGLPAKMLKRRISELESARSSSVLAQVRLIGREAEVGVITDALERASAERGGAILLSGAPGIGKSAICEAIVAGASMRGWRAAETRLHPSDVHRPMGLFVDLFSILLRYEGVLGASPLSLAQLRRLTQHDVHDEALDRLSQEAEAVQARIRSSSIDVLGAVSSEGPLLVVLEDLHWIDDASLRLLQHLVERTRGDPVFWLLTSRTEGRFPELRKALVEGSVPGMSVGPLPSTAGAELFRAFSRDRDGARDESVATLAQDVAGGNPLFLREIARLFVETGSVASLPGSVRALIHDRVARLTPLAQHVLHTCAVMGRYSTVPRVAAALEIATAQLLACIDELDALGIFRTGREADALALHDLWHEELLGAIRPASRNLLHHRCGVVLEAESRDSRSAAMLSEAARHLVAAGARSHAFALLDESATHLLANGLPEDAARTFELAEGAASDEPERFRMVFGRLEALRDLADWGEITRILPHAVATYGRAGTSSTHSELELLEMEAMCRGGPLILSAVHRALECIADEGASEAHRATAAKIGSMGASNLGMVDELATFFRAAESLQLSDPAVLSDALAVRTIYHTEVGSLETAVKDGARAIALERERQSVRALVQALRRATYAARCLGNFAAARRLLQEALELSIENRLVADAAYAADVAATVCIEMYDFASAEILLSQALALAQRVKSNQHRTSLTVTGAMLALIRGDVSTATDLVGTDLDQSASDPIVRQRTMRLAIQVRLLMRSRDTAALRRAVSLLSDALIALGAGIRRDYAITSLALGLDALGRRTEAVGKVREYVEGTRREQTPIPHELQQLLDKAD